MKKRVKNQDLMSKIHEDALKTKELMGDLRQKSAEIADALRSAILAAEMQNIILPRDYIVSRYKDVGWLLIKTNVERDAEGNVVSCNDLYNLNLKTTENRILCPNVFQIQAFLDDVEGGLLEEIADYIASLNKEIELYIQKTDKAIQTHYSLKEFNEAFPQSHDPQ
jgi:hypothetical protein